MLQVKKLIGDVEVMYQSDGKDLKEDIVKVSWLTNAPTKCGICQGTDIYLQGRVTKEGEYIYAEFVCKECFAKATIGEYKNPKGALFVKKWEKYERIIKTDKQ